MAIGPKLILYMYAGGLLLAAGPPTFENTVQPLLTKTCTPCHNAALASGGMVIAPFTRASSIAENREAWGAILQKLRSGEMPARRRSAAAPNRYRHPVGRSRIRED
jgi:hypothetical protein